jgi:RNA polymerase sigma-70 factor, ECF subfamily
MLSQAEKYIIDSIKSGDKKAYEMLFKGYYSNLCKYARNIVRNEATAEDLVMDIFIKIWESGTELVINTSLPGYLYRCVHNHCLNYLTRKHKQFIELNDETIDRLNKIIPPDMLDDANANMNLTVLQSKIEKGIEQLPEACRKIFVMSRTEELSHNEIANRLNISENTVKVQIYRALVKLRLHLQEFLPGMFIF